MTNVFLEIPALLSCKCLRNSADNSGGKIQNTTKCYFEFPFKIKDKIGSNFFSSNFCKRKNVRFEKFMVYYIRYDVTVCYTTCYNFE